MKDSTLSLEFKEMGDKGGLRLEMHWRRGQWGLKGVREKWRGREGGREGGREEGREGGRDPT